MADILIRGMEMPKDGRITIQIGADGAVYFVENCRIMAEKYEKNSHAVTLPEGHGRCIDADKLAEDLQFDVEYDQRALDDLNIIGIERERIQFDKDCKQNCMWYLSNCPTIVPAEGGGGE